MKSSEPKAPDMLAAARPVLMGANAGGDPNAARLLLILQADKLNRGEAMAPEVRDVLAEVLRIVALGGSLDRLRSPARKVRDWLQAEGIAAAARIFDLFGLKGTRGAATKTIAEVLGISETKVRDAKRAVVMPEPPGAFGPLEDFEPETGLWRAVDGTADAAGNLDTYAFYRRWCEGSVLWQRLTTAPVQANWSAVTRDQVERFRRKAAEWDRQIRERQTAE